MEKFMCLKGNGFVLKYYCWHSRFEQAVSLIGERPVPIHQLR